MLHVFILNSSWLVEYICHTICDSVSPSSDLFSGLQINCVGLTITVMALVFSSKKTIVMKLGM